MFLSLLSIIDLLFQFLLFPDSLLLLLLLLFVPFEVPLSPPLLVPVSVSVPISIPFPPFLLFLRPLLFPLEVAVIAPLPTNRGNVGGILVVVVIPDVLLFDRLFFLELFQEILFDVQDAAAPSSLHRRFGWPRGSCHDPQAQFVQ